MSQPARSHDPCPTIPSRPMAAPDTPPVQESCPVSTAVSIMTEAFDVLIHEDDEEEKLRLAKPMFESAIRYLRPAVSRHFERPKRAEAAVGSTAPTDSAQLPLDVITSISSVVIDMGSPDEFYSYGIEEGAWITAPGNAFDFYSCAFFATRSTGTTAPYSDLDAVVLLTVMLFNLAIIQHGLGTLWVDKNKAASTRCLQQSFQYYRFALDFVQVLLPASPVRDLELLELGLLNNMGHIASHVGDSGAAQIAYRTLVGKLGSVWDKAQLNEEYEDFFHRLFLDTRQQDWQCAPTA